jgi:transposase
MGKLLVGRFVSRPPGSSAMRYLELTPVETWQLRELTRTAVGRVALRALMVLWRAEGLTTLQIGERLDCHRETVSLWLERYRTLGIEGLHDEPRSGRPPSLDAAARQQVEAALDHPPPEEEQPRACWTLAALHPVCQSLARAPCCRETLRRAVHALGFRFRRPRLWAHQQDPASFEKQLLVELAKAQAQERAAGPSEDGASPVHFLYADASDHQLLAVLRAMWMRIGQQVRIQTPPRNGRWTLFGSLNILTGQFCWQAYEKAITATFLEFLAYLLVAYPQGDVLLVVDRASYHTSRATVAWLKAHPRLLLLYLPSRRPDLNPVERIWAPLKEAVSANRSFANLLVLGQFISRYFAALSPVDFLRQAGVRSDFCEAT